MPISLMKLELWVSENTYDKPCERIQITFIPGKIDSTGIGRENFLSVGDVVALK